MVINAYNKLIYGIPTKNEPISGEFRLGVISTVFSYLIPLFIKKFSLQYPKITLQINEINTQNIIRDLNNDQIDGAILATPTGNESFKEHFLYYENFLIFIAKVEELLNKNEIMLKNIDWQKMWTLHDGHYIYHKLLICTL